MGVISTRHSRRYDDQGQTRRHRPDYWLLILTLSLAVIGIIVVFSISPALAVEKGVDGNQYILRQIIALGLGTLIFALTATVPIQRWKHLFIPFLVIAAVVTLMALLMPVNAQYPAHRWIRFAGFSFQSVELVKFAGIMWLASFLTQRMGVGKITEWNSTLKPLAIVLVGVGLIVAGLQSDLGSFGVIVAIMSVMAFTAGMPVKPILMFGGIILVIVTIFISTTSYRRDRFTAYIHPEKDCLTSGYQACQALIAVGSGGLIGLGLGRSVQAYGYLPEAENDSIFAIFAEKFGLIGVTAFLALFMVFFARIKRVMEHAPDDFSRLVVLGILVWLSAQTIINIGAMLGLLPLKGITLPLVSYGGSSILMVMAALGVVFQVSKYTSFTISERNELNGGAGYENSRDRRRVRGSYYTPVSRRP